MKEHLFTMHGWYCWFIHNLIVLGAFTMALFIAMQWQGIYVEINLPTIQHVFKK